MLDIESLKIRIFADVADKPRILELYANPAIQGFTTNPTLMRQAGITNYEDFARDLLAKISDRPFSFEVFSDDFSEMERQADKIVSWGGNVFVKIPVTNTLGESAAPLIRRLVKKGVPLNVTAILTLKQIDEVVEALAGTKRSMSPCSPGASPIPDKIRYLSSSMP